MEYKSIEEKIKNLDWEANFNNDPEDVCRVGMFECYAVNDDATTISTYSVATCVALAIAATDRNGKIHRIITHNPYCGEQKTKNIETRLKTYIHSLEPIQDLKVMICSMESFENLNSFDKREEEILYRINDIFAFYKEQNPEFNIPFHRSWYVKISPDGLFEYADSKMVETYRELKKVEFEENLIRYNKKFL